MSPSKRLRTTDHTLGAKTRDLVVPGCRLGKNRREPRSGPVIAKPWTDADSFRDDSVPREERTGGAQARYEDR